MSASETVTLEASRIDTALALRRGAESFLDLLRRIDAKTSTDVEAGNGHPELDDVDLRDYRVVSQMVRDSFLDNLNHPDEVHREGFLRAVSDLLCLNVDGCGVTPNEPWDPIKNTARAFAQEGAHG